MAWLQGTISMTGLPPNRGMIIHICFFSVPDADTPPPHDGDPPAEAATDCDKVFERFDPNQESHETVFTLDLTVERPLGYYYVQVRVILFRSRNGEMIAQAEQFFFGGGPIQIAHVPEGRVTFPLSWPTIPLEALQHYGTIRPESKRPWWKFW